MLSLSVGFVSYSKVASRFVTNPDMVSVAKPVRLRVEQDTMEEGEAAVPPESAEASKSETSPPDASKESGKEPEQAKDQLENANAGQQEPAKAPHMGSHYHQKKLQELAKSADVPLPDAEGERTVYVGNLDWSVDDARLHKLFSAVDGLKEVRLVKDFLQRSKGYAYVDYQTSQQVDEAVQKFNGKEVNKRPLKVARSKPTKGLFEEKTVFVSKIAPAANETMVRE
eukprot:5038831-Amphidinium_carterae.1